MQYQPIEQKFSVSFNYGLHFTRGLFGPENDLLADILRSYNPDNAVKAVFVIDGNMAEHHQDLQENIRKYCRLHKDAIDLREILTVPGGEAVKNDPANVESVLEAIDRNHICRHSFVLAVGGGAVIDMAGYAASIAHRGVRLIRIPTTVLAQNDAAVGVKNGVNHFGKKNFVGTFSVPYAIINDVEFLTTLDQRDWISGVAEGVKVSLIKDKRFFEFIEREAKPLRERDSDKMQELIYRCAELHMQHIAGGGDPFESGSSRPLDFGHWAAHKLEYMTGYAIRHGEAVAIGMALDVVYAEMSGLLSESARNRVTDVLSCLGFNLRIPVESDKEISELLGGIEEFREHLGGELTITLIDGIGSKHDVHEIDLDRMQNAIRHLSRWENKVKA